MHNIFSLAEQVLSAEAIQTKLALTYEAWRLCETHQLGFESDSEPLPIDMARFPEHPILVAPKKVPHRNLNKPEGLIGLLHAVAHIEFSAIQLAWDHLYRFRDFPEDYYKDWLNVAQEEAQHFELIQERLQALGSDYGKLPAHAGLWKLAEATADDPLARMALVPRFMEARGLDVTPAMIDKLQQMNDLDSANRLTRILNDEVGHVALGSRWFQILCQQRGLNAEDEYFALIKRYLKIEPRGPFNLEMRRQAGFSERELSRLENNPA